MTRRIATLTIVSFSVVEETDDADHPPSIPPFTAETTADSAPESARPLAKCLPSNVIQLRRVGS